MFGVEQEPVFHNSVGDESTRAVFQRVPLRPQAAFGAATMFHSLVEGKKVRGKQRFASLVGIPSDEEGKAPVKIIRLLRTVSEVIDLSNRKRLPSKYAIWRLPLSLIRRSSRNLSG